MRTQRPPAAAPCLAAVAESLPFADQCFDAAMSVLSDHHWADPLAGPAEMTRVARRMVVVQFDTSDPARFWLTRDYLPEFAHLSQGVPTLTERAAAIGARLEAVPGSLGLRRRVLPRLLAPPARLPAARGPSGQLGMGMGRARRRVAHCP